MDTIWSSYKVYPILPHESQRKEGRAISEALAHAVNSKYGASGPTVCAGPDNKFVVLKKNEPDITADDVEIIYRAIYEEDQNKWYTFRVHVLEKHWNGTKARESQEWLFKPQKAETIYHFDAQSENWINSTGQGFTSIRYRQFYWSQERKRTFRMREWERRGPFLGHPVYNNDNHSGF